MDTSDDIHRFAEEAYRLAVAFIRWKNLSHRQEPPPIEELDAAWSRVLHHADNIERGLIKTEE